MTKIFRVSPKRDLLPAVHIFLPWVALVSVWFLWGSTYIGIRYAVKTIPPFLMSGSRYAIAGPVLLLIFVAINRGWPAVSLRQLISAAIAGAIMILGGNGLLSLGEQHLQSGNAALLVATVPLIMVVESALIRRQGIASRSLAAIVFGSLGVLILVGAPDSNVDYAAAAVVFVGAFFWGTGSVYLTVAELPPNPVLATALQMTFGGVLLLLLGLVTGEPSSLHFGSVSTASFLGWLWLIGPGALLGFTAYAYALKTLPTSTVAPYAYINPIVAVILGGLFGDQPLTFGLVVGGGAVILAVAVTLVKPKQKAGPIDLPELATEIA